MSMNGEYLRVTPAQLDRAVKDPEWAWDLVEEIQDTEAEGEPAPAEARHFTTHQTWHLLGFLLQRSAFPVDVVHGEEPIATDDWGYGPPRYLTPERVRLAADTLHRTTYGRLIQDVDPSELSKAEVYPLIWDSPASLEWASDLFTPLTEFFQGAASAGHAMLIWID
ncbi:MULTISPECIES: YfbM family protein [unclassified Streptomyces]|uniref:YfbM family protein n=1 Tax=unclassified Streptomyces TaxID=2593676 RepID=UPI002E0FEBDF|nr:YfbM family protein [Streptomyces sp. NBC_01201]